MNRCQVFWDVFVLKFSEFKKKFAFPEVLRLYSDVFLKHPVLYNTNALVDFQISYFGFNDFDQTSLLSVAREDPNIMYWLLFLKLP